MNWLPVCTEVWNDREYSTPQNMAIFYERARGKTCPLVAPWGNWAFQLSGAVLFLATFVHTHTQHTELWAGGCERASDHGGQADRQAGEVRYVTFVTVDCGKIWRYIRLLRAGELKKPQNQKSRTHKPYLRTLILLYKGCRILETGRFLGSKKKHPLFKA